MLWFLKIYTQKLWFNSHTIKFWKDLKKYNQQGFLIGCANTVKDENGNPEEGMGNSGILFNHAYGIQ